MDLPYSSPLVVRLVELALAEDLSYGDITSALVFSGGEQASARIIAREPLVVCGIGIIRLIAKSLNADWEISLHVADGDKLGDGGLIAEIRGDVSSLLSAERTILNFMQRLSGVATYTNVTLIGIENLVVLDTRKTTPGWRVLEKYATRIGGACNHRMNLGDMVLVKNNHIDAALLRGVSLGELLQKIADSKPWGMTIECEVRSEVELHEALAGPVDIVMLDNMSLEEIRRCIEIVRTKRPDVRVEVSGGVTKKMLPVLAEFGNLAVSMGALTTQASNKDISMRIVIS